MSEANGNAISVNNPKLADAIQEAQILLSFAAQSGTDFSNDIAAVLIDAETAAAAGAVPPDKEIAFWLGFRALSKAVAPVTVASLRATMDSDARRFTFFGRVFQHNSLARKSVRWYTLCAIVTLFFLLSAQIYWIFGTTLTSNIEKTNGELIELTGKMLALEKPSVPPGAGNKPAASNTGSDNTANVGELQTLKAQKESLQQRKASFYVLLAFWGIPWDAITQPQNAGASKPGPEQIIAANMARVYTANIVLEILQRYVLPLLYGLLGACVYVLRTLTTEIKSRTYSESSNIEFRIRLYLGTLCGMIIAWFVIPDASAGILKSLSPFALAFLGGYSVELVFAAMDRLLAAFTSKSSTAPRMQ